jgi:hypothetical protein
MNHVIIGFAIILAVACGGCTEKVPRPCNQFGCPKYIDAFENGNAVVHVYCNDFDTAVHAIESVGGNVTKISKPVFGQDTYKMVGIIPGADVKQLEADGWEWWR